MELRIDGLNEDGSGFYIIQNHEMEDIGTDDGTVTGAALNTARVGGFE